MQPQNGVYIEGSYCVRTVSFDDIISFSKFLSIKPTELKKLVPLLNGHPVYSDAPLPSMQCKI